MDLLCSGMRFFFIILVWCFYIGQKGFFPTSFKNEKKGLEDGGLLLLSEDLSEGVERQFKARCVNNVDDCGPPKGTTYTVHNIQRTFQDTIIFEDIVAVCFPAQGLARTQIYTHTWGADKDTRTVQSCLISVLLLT